MAPILFKVGMLSRTLYEVSASTKTYGTINDWESFLELNVVSRSTRHMVCTHLLAKPIKGFS